MHNPLLSGSPAFAAMNTLDFSQHQAKHMSSGSVSTHSGLPSRNPPLLYHRGCSSGRALELHSFDEDYVDRLIQGDTETATDFVRYFTKLLVVKLRMRLRSSTHEAEDVAQETLLRVLVYLRKSGGMDDARKLGAFVNSFSERVMLEFLRNGRRFQQIPENAPEPVEQAIGAEFSCITNERKQLLRQAMSKLRKNDQVVLEKVYFVEQDKDAICAELGIDRNYLRVQVHRALGRLRDAVSQGDPKPKKKAAAV